MSVKITIQGTEVEFPTSGSSPSWAEAVVEFAQLVEAALSGVAGSYDISPQSFTLDSYNGSGTSLPNLSFPTSTVRGATIHYALYRTTSTSNAQEKGVLEIVYNANGPIGNKWEMAREYTGDGQISFTISDDGQISFTTTLLAGTGHAGKITYYAKSLEN